MQELTIPSYVANDTYLVGGQGIVSQDVREETNHHYVNAHLQKPGETQEESSMLIMTGPNYSGKSVYLKKVALIVFMAHVGCFVPADAAIIGLTDKILTRMATKETTTKIQSVFMIDLQQVTKAINLSTHRSLVIIDEFGKGTDSSGELARELSLWICLNKAIQMGLAWLVVCSNTFLVLEHDDLKYWERRTSMRFSRMASSNPGLICLLATWKFGSMWKLRR